MSDHTDAPTIEATVAEERELSPEELDEVSGGSSSQTAPNGQYWSTSHTGGGGAYGE